MNSMKLTQLLAFSLLLATVHGQFTLDQLPKLNALSCENPRVRVHVFSGTEDPEWTIHLKQLRTVQSLVQRVFQAGSNIDKFSKPTTRVMGYHGFSIRCSPDQSVFVNGLVPVEDYLLFLGRNHLSSAIYQHIQEHVGEVIADLDPTDQSNADCNQVPIRGPDTVPTYSPNTDDGGCFVKRQTENNCYAYGTDIVTNTFPQPGRGSGKKWIENTCQDMGNSSVRDGLVYNGTLLPTVPPSNGHFAALLIWPGTNFHWIRMDVNGHWSHKPGGTPVRNVDNRGLPITDPSKSDFSPWTQFCAYFVAQPSILKIN